MPVDWADTYLRARRREGRVLDDDLVASLPHLPRSHPLAAEWRYRADSCDRLYRYVLGRSPARVVELGCGNGWLANRLAAAPVSLVVGADVNVVELEQARRVFRRPNLEFVVCDIDEAPLPVARPDLVVLASTLQYVARPVELIGRLLDQAAPGGEVHVLDSPLYAPDALDAARQRTEQHYAGIGVPEMADHYHHHTWDDLEPLAYDLLYDPRSLRPRLERRWLRRPRALFPWLRFRRAPA